MSLVYLDNAATTQHKPQAVIDAVTAAMCSFGGPGRGSHQAALDASLAVFGARQAVSNQRIVRYERHDGAQHRH